MDAFGDTSIRMGKGDKFVVSQFCTKCGAALGDGAQFCARCGAAVTTGPAPAVVTGAPPPPDFSVPPPPPLSLADSLGVGFTRNFLIQHLLVGPKHSYRVMSRQKAHLFTIGENLHAERQAIWDTFIRPATGGTRSGGAFRWIEAPTYTAIWGLEDRENNLRGAFRLGYRSGLEDALLTDASGTPIVEVHISFGMESFEATAALPNGLPVLSCKGSRLHHNFTIQEPRGAEVAKLHEDYVSARGTYNLDILGSIDPVYPILLAVLIDNSKGK